MCENIGQCGGCCYRELNYEEQLKIKSDFIETKLSKYINKSQIEKIIPSPKHLEYRNKMEFSFGDCIKNGKLTLGLHKKKSFYSVLNAYNCDLITSDIKKVLKLTVDFFNEKNIPYFHKKTHKGFLRHLVVRKSFTNNNLLINIVTTYNTSNFLIDTLINEYDEEKILIEYKNILIKNINNISGIIRTKNNSFSDAVKNDGIDVLYGDIYLYENLLGLNFKISPFSFFQTNTLCAEKLYEKINEYLVDENYSGKIIYDLYSGTGTISQIISKNVKYVYSCEIVKEAVDMAIDNININNIKNIKCFNMDVKNLVLDIDNNIINIEKPDCIIVDPPREGVLDKPLSYIINFNAKHIIYISCKIESFVSNFEVLKQFGYVIKKICPVDMFPYTNNVETVILLEKCI